MFSRLINLSKSHSFFLFGARGVGKTRLLQTHFSSLNPLSFDLLNPELVDRFDRDPSAFSSALEKLSAKSWVVIDEIQKLPKLLDLVHMHIEKQHLNFALTGSSARKLKKGAANLLAGRAFLFHLYPLTRTELAHDFDLNTYLSWGGLPYLHGPITELDRIRYLKSYASTYLQEEIMQEQIVRNLTPFRKFLEVAALSHAQVINYSKIARDVLSDAASIKGYFQILEDTLIAQMIPAFEGSIRKRLRTSPKFYFIDPGIVRSLRGSVEIGVVPGSFEYGRLFEGMVIGEIQRGFAYLEKTAKFSYLLTKDDAEIDLVIERPSQPRILVEIKSSTKVSEEDTSTLNRFAADLKPCRAFLLSRDNLERVYERVNLLPWEKGVSEIIKD